MDQFHISRQRWWFFGAFGGLLTHDKLDLGHRHSVKAEDMVRQNLLRKKREQTQKQDWKEISKNQLAKIGLGMITQFIENIVT